MFKCGRNDGKTEGRKDGRTDRLKTVYPPKTPFCGGYKKKFGGGGGVGGSGGGGGGGQGGCELRNEAFVKIQKKIFFLAWVSRGGGGGGGGRVRGGSGWMGTEK